MDDVFVRPSVCPDCLLRVQLIKNNPFSGTTSRETWAFDDAGPKDDIKAGTIKQTQRLGDIPRMFIDRSPSAKFDAGLEGGQEGTVRGGEAGGVSVPMFLDVRIMRVSPRAGLVPGKPNGCSPTDSFDTASASILVAAVGAGE